MRVLVVEDSEATRAFVRAVLESLPGAGEMELVEASGGFQALRLLPRGPYDVVLTDINMPDINGLELLKFIRSNPQHQHTKVLLMSTQAAAKDRDRGMALGADAYLTKPFSPEGLKDALQSLMSGPR